MAISSISGGDLDKVWEIKTLKKEKDEEARRLLEMAAKQVQPIMRKHKWQVKLLSEFWYFFLCLILLIRQFRVFLKFSLLGFNLNNCLWGIVQLISFAKEKSERNAREK